MEKDRVYKGKVKHSGIFDFKAFYDFLYDYLMDSHYDVFEKKYGEIKKAESKNLDIFWEAKKPMASIGKGPSKYFVAQIQVRYTVLGLQKVKVKRDNEEVSMDSATLELDFTADLIKDPENKWDGPFYKFLRNLYDKYIIKSRIEDYEMEVYQDVSEVINAVKAYLSIEGRWNF